MPAAFELKLIFFSIGVALLATTLSGLNTLRLALASLDWPRVDGTVLDAIQKDRFDRDGNNDPVLKLRYRYKVGIQTFESTRLWYRSIPFYNYEGPIPEVRENNQVDVYHDPNQPSRSVLIRGFDPMDVAGVALSGVLLVLYLVWRMS